MEMHKTINPDTHCFVEGFPLCHRDKCYFVRTKDVPKLIAGQLPKDEIIETIPSRVCECTGKRDSSGRDIWENDLIKVFAPGRTYDGILGVVTYDHELAWGICWDFEYETPKAMITLQDCCTDPDVKLLSLGNIIQQGFSSPGQWYEYLCREELKRRMAEA